MSTCCSIKDQLEFSKTRCKRTKWLKDQEVVLYIWIQKHVFLFLSQGDVFAGNSLESSPNLHLCTKPPSTASLIKLEKDSMACLKWTQLCIESCLWWTFFQPGGSPSQVARCSPPLPPNALGVSSPGETCRKGVKTGKLFYWEKQRKERKVTLKGYRRKRLSASN